MYGGADWRFDNVGDKWSFGAGEFWVNMKGGLGAYFSTGTADIKLPGAFDFKFDNSSNEFTVSANIGKGDALFSSYLGAGVGIDFELGAGIALNGNIPFTDWTGGIGFNFKSGFELDAIDVLLGAILPPGFAKDSVDTDFAFTTIDRQFSNNELELPGKKYKTKALIAEDNGGIKIDLTKALFDKMKFGSFNASHILGAELGVGIKQESIFDVIGFHFDENNDNRPDFSVNIGETFSYKLSNDFSNLRIQPFTNLKTKFSPQVLGTVSASFQNAINSVVPQDTPQWIKELIKVNPSGVNFDLNLTFPGIQVKDFNPFEVSNYWLPFR